MNDPDVHRAAVATLNKLRTDGWCHGGIARGATLCVVYALDAVIAGTAEGRVISAIAVEIGTRDSAIAVGEWNDAPERTFEDVEAVLLAVANKTAPDPADPIPGPCDSDLEPMLAVQR